MSRPSPKAPDAPDQGCLICKRITQIAEQSNPYFVAELHTGYVVLGDFQYWRGYTLFLCKHHCLDLTDLEPEFREVFLREMSDVAAAVHRAFRPHHLNYELLGNAEPHLHWHLFPRYEDEPDDQRRKPVWTVDKALRYSDAAKPAPDELTHLKSLLRVELRELPQREPASVPARLQRHIGAYGACIDHGHVLLVRKMRGPFIGLLDFPGGSIEFGEEPEAALRREVLEETGLVVQNISLRGVESKRVRYHAADGVDEELHHVGLIYDVAFGSANGTLPTPQETPDGEDGGGAVWVEIVDLDKSALTPFACIALFGADDPKDAVPDAR